MAAFHLDDFLESVNHGVNRYNLDQIYPVSGNVNNTVGTGSASGVSSFQFAEYSNWWSPSASYFIARCEFNKGQASGGGILKADYTTYADNFIMTLFTQITTLINSQPLDTIATAPWIVDTALTYSNAHNNFLKTYGSLTRVGEALSTRLLNVTQNSGIVEVVFRPPVSLFDVKCLPPGAQFRIDFNWASSSQLAFESLLYNSVPIGTATGQFNIAVRSLSFYKASISPGPEVPLPQRGIIDLCPCSINQYFGAGTNQLQQNITLPGTTNRILVVFQDVNNVAITSGTTPLAISAAGNLASGVGGGYNPATSFTVLFTSQAASPPLPTTALAQITNLWLSLPEIGATEPKPIYQFDTKFTDLERAYSDWAHTCQGTHSNMEGSIPYGSPTYDLTTINYVGYNAASPAVLQSVFTQAGNINNPQQVNYQVWESAASLVLQPTNTAGASNLFNQTTRWGWAGRCPGPIFAFPVVRTDGSKITAGTINATFGAYTGTSANPVNFSMTVLASYSQALAVEHMGNGQYSYQLVTGV
jgi:hypothetical protein